MSTAYQFPLVNSQQTLQITLGNVLYTLRVYWNSNQATNAWVLDIADANGIPMVTGIPLVTGTDLLAQYGYLNFGGQLIAQTSSNTDAPPTYVNLGSDGNLFFVTTP
jgi:hypothetical protein